MAAGTGFSPSCVIVEDGFNNDIPSRVEERSHNLDPLDQPEVGKPPRHLSVVRHSLTAARLLTPSNPDFDLGIVGVKSDSDVESEYMPMIRSGSCAEKGPKEYMEDEHICIDNLLERLEYLYISLRSTVVILRQQVFDGHGGTDAAMYVRKNILKENKAKQNDHKPNSISERNRIEQLGGVIYDGYLNGRLSVARALGDWHMKGPKGAACALTADHPELQETLLTEDDKFLIMGCDGLWDVMSSQCAVTIARKELMIHNDPERCSRQLVREALKRSTRDNLTVIVLCFSPDPPPWIEIQSQMGYRSVSSEGQNFLKGILDGNS
ncbi:hypothetical protein L1987_10716 [Smallanthus sonchifolius]|uniref:Uncharacterized protein n=1 Tax=Smallanthus sonchifolius TaxID=185202 RepID=A0ACB9JB47_9ASTR|nr:hypothetical protein L1987_10716 [Smallanthus sonchifolius]